MTRQRWCIVVLLGLGLLLAATRSLGPELWARSWEAKWRDFRVTWEARGEQFSAAAQLPPVLPDEQNAARHPWIACLIAATPATLARLEAMDPANVPGADEVNLVGEADELADELAANPDLAARLASHFGEFDDDLAAFAEGMARESFRPDFNLEAGLAATAPYRKIGDVIHVFRVRAILAIANGQSPVADVSTLLRVADHLRHEPTLMGLMIGVGSEAMACVTGELAQDRGVLPPDDQAALAARLAAPHPGIGEAMARALRFERDLFLQEIDRMENELSHDVAVPNGWQPRWAALRVFFARNRLALCEDLQEQLFASGTGVRTAIRLTDLPRYQAALEMRYAEPSPYEAFAALGFGAGQLAANKMARSADLRQRLHDRLSAR